MCYIDMTPDDLTITHIPCGETWHLACWDSWVLNPTSSGGTHLCAWCRAPINVPQPADQDPTPDEYIPFISIESLTRRMGPHANPAHHNGLAGQLLLLEDFDADSYLNPLFLDAFIGMVDAGTVAFWLYDVPGFKRGFLIAHDPNTLSARLLTEGLPECHTDEDFEFLEAEDDEDEDDNLDLDDGDDADDADEDDDESMDDVDDDEDSLG